MARLNVSALQHLPLRAKTVRFGSCLASLGWMKTVMLPTRRNPVPTRYTLLSRLHDWDDAESWREFFETYWRLIYSIAMKSGLNEAEAEDVVQETVICVAK